MFMIHKIRKEILCDHDMPEMALQGTVNENNQHFSWHNNGEKRKGSIKMDISKQTQVRIVSFTVAIVGVLAVRIYNL